MRLPFLEIPGEARELPRPVVPVQLEDVEHGRLPCLVDTGSTANRMPAALAEFVGVPLDQALARDEVVVGGLRTEAVCVRVDLTVAGHQYEAPVWFCDPWPFSFGLLGQEGFFRFFRVTICAAENWLECVPEAALSS